MRRGLIVGGVAVICAGVGFVAGAWWYATTMLEAPAGPAVAPIARAPQAVDLVPAPSPPPLPAPTPEPPAPAAPLEEEDDPVHCPALAFRLQSTQRELAGQLLKVRQLEEQRVANEGAPVAYDSRPVEPRFEPETLRSSVVSAFAQAGVPGRVRGLDCTEWPCIVYGRIRGSEDQMEKLEEARALAAYEGDILTVLLWAATDEAANEAAVPILPGRPEQTLFAMAWYPRGMEPAISDNVDRRLRTRTANLWNTMSPSDVTGQ